MTDDSFIMGTYAEKKENMYNNIILYIIYILYIVYSFLRVLSGPYKTVICHTVIDCLGGTNFISFFRDFIA